MLIKTLVLKTPALTHSITTPVTTSIGAVRIRLSVGTDDGKGLRFLEGKSTVILQKDNALLADFAHDTVVGWSISELGSGKPKGCTWHGQPAH
jgi:hypothetical protein